MIHYAILPGRYVAVIAPTKRGWRCRSNVRGALCHDYIRGESIGNVCGWLRLLPEHRDLVVTTDRDEVCAHVADGAIGNAFLTLDPDLSPDAQADRVVTHLETGW